LLATSLAASLYTALYWAAAGRPAEPWDALVRLLWVGSGLMAFVLGAGLSKLRTQGHSWPTLRLAVLHKPAWWIGWYPRSLRLGHDVWDRLPAGLRIGRATVWSACLLPFLLFGYLFLAFGADVQYGLTGRRSFIFMLRSVVDDRSLIRGLAPAIPLLLFLGMAFVFRFMRQASRDRPKELEELIVKAQFWDTGDQAFWSRPENEDLLLPAEGARASVTPASDAILDRIETTSTSLPASLREVGFEAVAAARRLRQSFRTVDSEAGTLTRDQQDERLERLSLQLTALGDHADDEERARVETERVRRLCAEIGQQSPGPPSSTAR
jgi:hypothetical protein